MKSQHQDRCVDFLVKELKVCLPKEADERVFFVSARETLQVRHSFFRQYMFLGLTPNYFLHLQARVCESKGQPPNNGALADGFSTRYFEFQDFERKFEECISKSAVRTKFEQHSSRGKNIAM